jgi:hypothetical protein
LLTGLIALLAACSAGPRPQLPALETVSETDALPLAASLERLERAEGLIRKAGARDARKESFRHRPWARADVRSLAVLDGATDFRQGEAFWRMAAADGRTLFAREAARLHPEARAELAAIFGCDASPDDCLLERYSRDTDALLEAELTLLQQRESAGEPLSAMATAWREELRPSIKNRGRTLRRALTFPAFPFVYAWRKNHSAHEYEGPQWVDFAQALIFQPEIGPASRTSEDSTRREHALLARFAPLLVQEVDPEAAYGDGVDRIGTVGLVPRGEALQPVVDTTHAASYAYVETLRLEGQEFPQLIYTFWYPEHPKLKKGIDVEAGTVEGITLRITLDAFERPVLYETLYNCGCSHRLFVDRQLEAAARAEGLLPQGDRPFAIQREVEGKIDWIVPELVDVRPGQRPLLLVRAGFHMPASVRFHWPSEDLRSSPREPYTLQAYEQLENLPVAGAEDEARRASLFTDKGLVRGAARLEGVLLTPLGLYQAGQPRQRGTQLIHFDQADFDDPSIYTTYLRLPRRFFGEGQRVARTEPGEPGEPAKATAASAGGGDR